MIAFLPLLICAVLGYLIGCFSTGLAVSKSTGVDVRSLGSKSTGATNVSRVFGFKLGLVTFLGDCAKGIIAAEIGTLIMGRNGAMVASVFAVIGHNWPVFHDFKGGKGIATSCAVLLWLFPMETLIALAAGFAVIAFTKYVSLGSLTVLLIVLITSVFTRPFWPDVVFSLMLAAIGTMRHSANIERLLRGKESKFSFRKKG
ncbi:MAG: glycerol-3-phosphate 1-O-acyltransferase PlsY [Eubacteriales bacterium]|nr:glycerol-3-phosphate 1-O-acyltransferase PlsY [Eubacteriales bacterium]MDD4106282.1 glycerol-3-phosphate 1-O-acyltransferase PlsY [Eubacteriales bacterium]MDD4711651.1 glycerol-3-phosphate 1-O-acyltransferase PlsY [Eubacteriales bacterium]NLO16319.1 glycerol-3-phosphate 1-O-acyltransferase PlsY [Clostridiales bacterium]